MVNGIVNVYKEKGFTSFDVVAKMRGIFHQKKIGHTGTLDPDAEGVLPVCLGKATRVCDLLSSASFPLTYYQPSPLQTGQCRISQTASSFAHSTTGSVNNY